LWRRGPSRSRRRCGRANCVAGRPRTARSQQGARGLHRRRPPISSRLKQLLAGAGCALAGGPRGLEHSASTSSWRNALSASLRRPPANTCRPASTSGIAGAFAAGWRNSYSAPISSPAAGRRPRPGRPNRPDWPPRWPTGSISPSSARRCPSAGGGAGVAANRLPARTGLFPVWVGVGRCTTAPRADCAAARERRRGAVAAPRRSAGRCIPSSIARRPERQSPVALPAACVGRL